jgi:phage repressor protein C with HTH and peptisase S24 domain
MPTPMPKDDDTAPDTVDFLEVDKKRLWETIKELADERHMSMSALAKKAGLDASSFNQRRRFGPDGEPRWPQFPTVLSAMKALDVNFVDFAKAVTGDADHIVRVPLMTMDEMREGVDVEAVIKEVADNPKTEIDTIDFPGVLKGDRIYEVIIRGNDYEPIYRDKTRLMMNVDDRPQRDDLVLIATTREAAVYKLELATNKSIVAREHRLNGRKLQFTRKEVVHMHKVIWASQ